MLSAKFMRGFSRGAVFALGVDKKIDEDRDRLNFCENNELLKEYLYFWDVVQFLENLTNFPTNFNF